MTVTVAGAPPSPTLLGKLEELNFRPVHVYGLTETYGPHTVCEWHPEWDALPAEEQARLAARQGQGYAVVDLVRVVDDDMSDVPRDGETLGEVVMRGNNVMKGYYEQPEATAEAFRGGWFHSGDIGVWHPDGYIELRDRKKDIIISGGENISTIEVEQAVARHPAVLECAVVAIPDEKWGERPKAFVTLKPGAVGHRGGDHRVLPRSTSPTSSARPRSSSASCPRPRPARSRSSCCATRSGPGARSGSTEGRCGSASSINRRSRAAGTPAEAVQETLDLAQAAERLGYHRYWVAEHHSSSGLAGASPEVLIGQIAARTSHLRVGSGGVMLSHYSALKVAE